MTVDSKSTEANYDAWHRTVNVPTIQSEDTRHGVLISELLGDEDGPYEDG